MNKTEETLQMQIKLREKLPRGWTEKIGKKCGVKKQRASQVLGEWNTSSPIFQAILDLAEQHQEDLRKRNEKIKNLTSNEE